MGLVERVDTPPEERVRGSTFGGGQPEETGGAGGGAADDWPPYAVEGTGVADDDEDDASAFGWNVKLSDCCCLACEPLPFAPEAERDVAGLLLLPPPADDGLTLPAGAYGPHGDRSSSANWGTCDGRFHCCIVELLEYEMMSASAETRRV